MNKEKGRVPKLRFPGFTEDWEQRKLTDIAKTFIGLVTTMTENYRDSGTLLIRNSDIKEGQFIFSEKPIHLDEEFAEKNKTRRLQIGDVVTVHTGDIGTSAVIKEKEAGAIGFATINTRTDKRILNPYFLSTYFNTEKHKCYANSVSTGDGRSNYNIKDFNKLVISIPTLDEQEKISALINNINTIITLHQRKLEHLNLKKKALLQKLFPKNGERYPELRFPGFTDAWEQRKLESILIEYTEKNPENENLPVLTSSRQGLTKQEDHFGSVQRHDISDYNVIPLGFCTYRNRSDDKTFTFNINRIVPRGLVSKFYPVFEIKNGNADFITEYLNNNTEIIKSLAINAVGTSQVVLSLRTLRNIEITLPLKAEQVAIGNLMRKLDIYITLHQ